MRETMIEYWGKLSLLYDQIYPLASDLEFWPLVIHDYIPKEPQQLKILELGAGTGRITIHLAKRGFNMTALELSDGMLDRLNEKLAGLLPETKQKINVVKGDMRRFDINERFDAIIIPGNTYPFLTDEERNSTLQCARLHLKKDGIFIVDVWQKNLDRFPLGEGWTLWSYDSGQKHSPYLDKHISWCEYCTINPQERLEIIEVSGHIKRGDNVWDIYTRFIWNLLTKDEIEQELKHNGFIVQKVYGEYEMDEWNEDSSLMTFLAVPN